MFVLATTITNGIEREQMEFCPECWATQEPTMIACYVDYDVIELQPSDSNCCDECGACHPDFKKEVFV